MDRYVGISLFLLSIFAATHAQSCPRAWTRVRDQCYILIDSFAVDIQGFPTVAHARRGCKEQGGDLAYFKDQAQENGAYAIIRSREKSYKPGMIYIGLSDLLTEGNFTWMNNDEPLAYNDWAPNEPNNDNNRKNEACVVVQSLNSTWSSPDQTEWHDYPCCQQARIMYSLCSMDVRRSTSPQIESEDSDDDFLSAECNLVDECESNPCLNGGTCHDFFLRYRCECPPEYNGTHCETEVTCPLKHLQDATLGTIHVGDPFEDDLPLDSTLSVRCIPGYTFAEPGSPSMKRYNCTVDGWKLIETKVLMCPRIHTWEGLILSNTSSRVVGSELNYTCEEGYKFKDSDGTEVQMTSVCTENLVWEPPIQTCVVKVSITSQMKEEQPEEAPGASFVGGLGMIFIAVEVAACVLYDLTELKKHLTFGYRNLRSRWPKKKKQPESPETATTAEDQC